MTANDTAERIITLTIHKPKPVARDLGRFKRVSFTNRGGSTSWRVTGTRPNGSRVRENFPTEEAAQDRLIELEAECRAADTETVMRHTNLSHEQLQLAGVAIKHLGDDWPRLLDIVNHWRKNGQLEAKTECPRLDDAVTQFLADLEARFTRNEIRFHAKRHLKTRVNLFAGMVGNPRLDSITVDTVEKFLSDRNVSARTKINDRSAVSTFFRWCIARPRQWLRHNPVRDAVRIEPEQKSIVVATVEQCERLLKEAQKYKRGKMLLCVVSHLYGGLRPYEVQRITPEFLNLKDGEIRIEPWMTKTKRKRVVLFNDGPPAQKAFNACLKAWLSACKGQSFFPPNADNDLQALKRKAGIPAVVDILRHTAISHFFRLTGSYGLTAEQFGNSEAKIKSHYQGRVSSADTRKFYAMRPKGK